MFRDPVVTCFLIPLTLYVFVRLVVVDEIGEPLSDRLRSFVAHVIVLVFITISLKLGDLWLEKVIELVKEGKK